MKKSLTIIVLVLIASLASAQNGVTFTVDENVSFENEDLMARLQYSGEDVIEEIFEDEGMPGDTRKWIAWSFADNEKFHTIRGKDVFFRTVVRAYAEHRPLVLSPDMIWVLISQGFARYVNAHSEELRSQSVDHDGKMHLVVKSDKELLSEDADWEKMMSDFTAQIERNTKGGIGQTITADFSTTGVTERITSQITLMETLKDYFEYVVVYMACGIPTVTLTGTPQDWQKVLEKTKRLEKYGVSKWTQSLEPILNEFVGASKGNPNQSFWKEMVKKDRVDKLEGGKCGPSPTELDGWILKFFPDENGQTLDKVPHTHKMPSERVYVDFKYQVINRVDGTIMLEVPMQLIAGFIGTEVDTLTHALTPKMGWAVRQMASNDSIKKRLLEIDKKPYSDGINLRVSRVPDFLSEMSHIKRLTLNFTNGVVLPEWFYDLKIEKLRIEGEMSKELEANIRKHFPKADIRRPWKPLRESDDPLIIVDSVIFKGKLSDIDPSTIKSQRVLKDALATAVYGYQGVNGVIEITTKDFVQKPEDLRGIPGTWFFLAKLDNPVDTLLLIPSDDQSPMKVKTLVKDEHGVFMFNTRLTEPCNFLIFTAPNDSGIFFDFNVHAEPGEVLSVQGYYDVKKPVYGLTFGGSRYYKNYADAFMRLNNPPKEEEDNGDIIDSILIVVNGKELPKSMNRQLINPYRRITEIGGKPPLTFEEQMRNQHDYYDLELKRDLRAYFLRRDEYVKEVRVCSDAAAMARYGRIGANGAIEVTTRPFLSVAPLSPNETKARRQASLLDIYATYNQGHIISSGSTFRPDGFVYNGEHHAYDPDLFDTPVKEQFFGQMTRQHGHMTNEYLGPLGSDSRGIYVPLIREVEIKLPAKVDQNHVDSVVNTIRKAARLADKSIERSDSLVRLAFIFGGKVKTGKPHPFWTYPLKGDGSFDIESSYYFTPGAKAESSWWAEACYKTTHPRQLLMHLISVDKLYASNCPAILDNRRHIEGLVLDDETEKPVADALVFIHHSMGTSDAGGVRTDQKGRFDLWLPYKNETLRVRKASYKDAIWIQPADTALTIRLIPGTSPKTQESFPKASIVIGNGVNDGDTISGIVRDSNGLLMGATVCEINKLGRIMSSTVTDFYGQFKLKVVSTQNELRFSYLDCKTVKLDINGIRYDVEMQPVEKTVPDKIQKRQVGY